MAITAGTRLGRYKILSPLGAGGMGEIYLAEDPELRRKIALKLLPARFTADADRLRRFGLEAKAASALNHPNIITVYEVGQADQLHFIATEFVDGQTVRQLLRHAPLPLAEALDIAAQTAAALSAAHEAGVIHRDIKPENVMVRRDGYVKVLDFGLAKLAEAAAPPVTAADSQARAVSQVNTEPGVVIGTVAYMSPEQARALKVDARTDLFSLGVLLYELVTGRAPFAGATPQDIRAAILHAEPAPLSGAGEAVPPELERIVTKALAKNRDERYQTAKDLQIDLKRLRRQMELEAELKRAAELRLSQEKTRRLDPVTPDTEEASRRARVFRGLLVALAAVAAGLLVWQWWPRAEIPNPTQEVKVASWRSEPNDEISIRPRFSPDGGLAVFCQSSDGLPGIWLNQLNGGDSLRVTKEKWSYQSPVWSPDGRRLAFISTRNNQSGIWEMPAFGGSPTFIKTLADGQRELVKWTVPAGRGNTIYYALDFNLYALNVSAGTVTRLTDFNPAVPMVRGFDVSPDETRLVYVDRQHGQLDLWVQPVQGGTPVRVTNDAADDSQPVWHPDGQRIIYSSRRSGAYQILVAHLDGRPPKQITSDASHHWVSDVSADGTKILYSSSRDEADLWAVELRTRQESQLTRDDGAEFWPDFSPDGETVAFQAASLLSLGAEIKTCAVMAKPLNGGRPSRQLAPSGFAPRWSPDGRQVAFLRSTGEVTNLWAVPATGGEERRLTAADVIYSDFSILPYHRVQGQDYSWSPDSRQLAYCALKGDVANVWTARADGSGETQITDNRAPSRRLLSPLWSADGQRIAYLAVALSSDGTARDQWRVYVAGLGHSDMIFQADSPLQLLGWSASGQELIVIADESPAPIRILQLPPSGGERRVLAQLEGVHFTDIQLSPDRRALAYLRRQDGADSLWLRPVIGGTATRLTSRLEPRTYLSSFAWSPDSQRICYGKQGSWKSIHLLTNFN